MPNHDPKANGQPPMARFIGAVFGLVFLGIGIAVIVFLWSAPFGAFGSPPLIFRVFGSFIAVAFVAVGGSMTLAAIKGVRPRLRPPVGFDRTGQQEQSAKSGYSCPRCGAPLGAKSDVSPHGDVKCKHCDSWFNIHSV